MSKHIKFPKIRGFKNVYREIQINQMFEPKCYRAKIKLHGTNAAVRITPEGHVYAQKRNDDVDLALPSDHFGFSGWVRQNVEFFASRRSERGDVIIFGEWAGPGVQAKVSVSQMDKKRFFPFAVQVSDRGLLVDPSDIEFLLTHQGEQFDYPADDIHVLPWFETGEFPETVDFRYGDEVVKFAEGVNRVVSQIDEVDPFIKDRFGIEGIGEGLVFYPMNLEAPYVSRHEFENFAFKVKGAGHQRGSGGAKPARIKEPPSRNEIEFVERHAHDARMQQAIQETGAQTIEDMGKMIGWVCRDIVTEEAQEIEEAGINPKRIGGIIANKTREWYMRYLDNPLALVTAAE